MLAFREVEGTTPADPIAIGKMTWELDPLEIEMDSVKLVFNTLKESTRPLSFLWCPVLTLLETDCFIPL